jgi:pyruvate formate lyase activating enzyme
MITRRLFIKAICLAPLALRLEAAELARQGSLHPQEAWYYRKLTEPKNGVGCLLCPRECVIPNGDIGFCRARKNTQGTLYALGYGSPCAVHVDPIEKKPFFHVRPTSTSFSIASAGCNLRCKFCQNWQISQVSPLETTNYSLPPEAVVVAAIKSGCESIAYTYTEPSNFFEYMLDVAILARKKGILNVYHSNGYINPEPLKQLCMYLDAADIDLKGFSQPFYAKNCDANLKPVLETLKTLKEKGIWLEITNLIIPGQNDDPAIMAEMCTWIRNNLGPDVPVHFSRFFPMYKMTNASPTPLSTVERAREIAMKTGLHYAYTGNVPGNAGESTYCPGCKKLLIKRAGYSVLSNDVKNGKCKYCGVTIKGLWSA